MASLNEKGELMPGEHIGVRTKKAMEIAKMLEAEQFKVREAFTVLEIARNILSENTFNSKCKA